ncbi:MAG: hypothetical protein ACYSVY_08065 [Planctomycetota bacterium]|jgi:hypothetical protein
MSGIGKCLAAAVLCTVLGLVSPGCSKVEFGESVSLPQEQHGSLLDDFAAGQPIELPSQTTFNLFDSQRASTGAGQADSSADPSGTAHCLALADAIGTAGAEFQLGHVLDNRGEGPLTVTVRFDVEYECRLQGNPTDTSKPEDQLGLRVFVRDSDKRVLKSMMLTDAGSLDGPNSWSGRQSPAFDVTLEPGLAHYFVLAGRVTSTGTETSAASARIDVRSLKIDLTPRN